MDVATRYFHTQTGKQAANALGNFHFDRGEFGLASLWYMRLFNSAPAVMPDPKWGLKAALALRQSGKTKDSDELLRRLQPNGAELHVDVGGDSVKPEAWLRRVTSLDQATIPVLQEWLQFFGSSRRTGTAAGGDPLLLSRWFQPTTQNKPVLDQMASLAQDLADSGLCADPGRLSADGERPRRVPHPPGSARGRRGVGSIALGDAGRIRGRFADCRLSITFRFRQWFRVPPDAGRRVAERFRGERVGSRRSSTDGTLLPRRQLRPAGKRRQASVCDRGRFGRHARARRNGFPTRRRKLRESAAHSGQPADGLRPGDGARSVGHRWTGQRGIVRLAAGGLLLFR